jgi:hypothetical protein
MLTQLEGGKAMNNKGLFAKLVWIASVATLGMFPAAAYKASAQEKPKRETIQAQAMGQNTAMGKTFNVTINIESYSTPADQKTLMDAFASGGHNALVKTLSKMKSQGRVAITGTLGYRIAYIRSFETENGRRIRLITDRPIHFKEAYIGGRSTDYDLSAIEINVNADPKKSDGSLIVAGKFKVDKDRQIQFESYGSGPWRLTNIMERN